MRRWPTAAKGRWPRSRRPAAGSVARRASATRSAARSPPRWLRSDDGERAVVELAEASGLSRLAPVRAGPDRRQHGRDRRAAASALDAGARRLVLGIGGSATTDGGAGLLRALGAVAERDGDRPVDLGGLDPRLVETDLQVACDVTNPLLGPTGAAATYGPQKGARPTTWSISTAARRLGRSARGRDGPARARQPRRRRGRRRRVRAALPHRSVPVPGPPPRRRPRRRGDRPR